MFKWILDRNIKFNWVLVVEVCNQCYSWIDRFDQLIFLSFILLLLFAKQMREVLVFGGSLRLWPSVWFISL